MPSDTEAVHSGYVLHCTLHPATPTLHCPSTAQCAETSRQCYVLTVRGATWFIVRCVIGACLCVHGRVFPCSIQSQLLEQLLAEHPSLRVHLTGSQPLIQVYSFLHVTAAPEQCLQKPDCCRAECAQCCVMLPCLAHRPER